MEELEDGDYVIKHFPPTLFPFLIIQREISRALIQLNTS